MIEEFQQDLLVLSSLQVYRKYVLSGTCYALDDNQHYKLREEVCEKLSVEFSDVILVGSGKLGFSLKPGRRFGMFNDDSDIDLAIVSRSLFEKVWEEAYLFKKSQADWPRAKLFFKYLSEGWIRPDKLPPSRYFSFSGDWWDFFNALTSSNNYGPYKIRAGLYYSHFFLQEYQKICIDQCIQEAN
jgi:predicted nucleotidyltransferase